MPRKMLMSWTGAKSRWRKMYKGAVYTVFCSELDLPEDQWTELGSYKAANDWWLAKRAEIDGRPAGGTPPPEAAAVLDKLKRKADYAGREGLGGEAAVYEEALADARRQVERGEYDLPDVDPKTAARLHLLEQMGFTLPAELDPAALDLALGTEAAWEDRHRREKAAPVSKRVGTHLDRWYELVHRRAKPTSVTNIHGYYREFKDFRSGKALVLHEDMDVAAITEERFADVFKAIDSQPTDQATKKKKWMYFKQFVNYLAEARLIPLPLNFRSKLLVFRVVTTSKAPPDPAAVRGFLDTLPDRLRLYALLALNCGMNNVDIGKLRPGQVDWKNRTLTRRRVKTGASPSVPTVTYRLWDETYRLLVQERSGSGEFVLTTPDGECLYLDEKIGNTSKVYDRIKTQWRDYFKGRKGEKKFKLMQFRFFGADLLRANIRYRSYRDPFLGHAPRSTGDKSYSSDEDVSPACKYLEKLFFPAKQRR